LTVECLLL